MSAPWRALSLGMALLVPAAAMRATARSFLAAEGQREATPVEQHGMLQVQGGRLVDAAGLPMRLRGVSLSSSQFGASAFFSARTVQWLAKDWKVQVVRAALGIEDGYLVNPEAPKARVLEVVNAAIAEGIYVIVDWQDHNAEKHLDQAKEFFEDVARLYGQTPNVLFEPFSQPAQQNWSTAIKPYHESVLSVIRKHSDNLVILGTARWSQGVDEAAADPVAGTNLAYALHFNAMKGAKRLRNSANRALARNVAVFSSQWSAVGNASSSLSEVNASVNALMDFCAEKSISDVNWAISNDTTSGSALIKGTTSIDGWQVNDLTGVGALVRASLRAERAPVPPCESCSPPGANCMSTGCCSNPKHTCFAKDAYFATCMETCAPGVHPEDAPEYQSSWQCSVLGSGCTAQCAVAGDNCKASGCCRNKALQCFNKDDFFSSCMETCTPGVNPLDTPAFQAPWTCNIEKTTSPGLDKDNFFSN